MNRFDNLYKHLCSSHIITEADALGPIPGDPDALGGANAAGPAAAAPGNVPSALPQDPAPISPEDNADMNQAEDKSELMSQKKIQLIKLIAAALSSPSPLTKDGDGQDTRKLHKIRMALGQETVEGNVKQKEDTIINVIAALQHRDPKDIASQIDYVDATNNPENSADYVPVDEYTKLVELARKALLIDPEKISESDRENITASDIDSSNAKETLTLIKTMLGPSL